MADLYIPTEEDIAFFQTNGYWLSPKLFDDDELANLREHHARVIAGDYETKRPPLSRNPEVGVVAPLVQVNNAYWTDGTIGRLVLDERLGAIAAHLAGVNGVISCCSNCPKVMHKAILVGTKTRGIGCLQIPRARLRLGLHLTMWMRRMDVWKWCLKAIRGI